MIMVDRTFGVEHRLYTAWCKSRLAIGVGGVEELGPDTITAIRLRASRLEVGGDHCARQVEGV